MTNIYRNDVRAPDIKRRLKRVGDPTRDSFRSIVNTRGGHVHDARFDDDELGRLRVLALLTSSGNKGFAWIERNAFRAAKSSKVQWMNDNNREVKKFLDLYFKEISRFVLTPELTIRYPKHKWDKS